MIIKKFQAGTETEAILLAKEELGKNAIVMNIKTILPKGIYKLFRKPIVEITAAIDETKNYSDEKQQEIKTDSKSIPKNNPNIIYDEPEKTNPLKAFMSEKEEKIEKDTSAIEVRLNNLQSMLEQQMSSKEKKEHKEEKNEQTEVKPENENPNMGFVQLVYNQMIANDVEERFANQVIGEIEGKLKKDSSVDQILSSIYQKIILKLGQAQIIDAEEGKRKFVFFIGPTGVGKTTTIAKIASNLKMKQKLKIALVTSDTYRIAAMEQLRTYANILHIPLHVIYSEEEVQDVVAEFEGYDIILIDTAGRSHKNREQRDDIEKLIHKVPEESREVYLVLSATTKYHDLIRITETYSEITQYRLIFTKLDETTSVGNIFNLRMLTGAPLSYTTFGQNVPDDISKLDPQSIAKQILGGNE